MHPKQVENNSKTKSNAKSKSAQQSSNNSSSSANASTSDGSNPSLKIQKDHFDKKDDTNVVVKERSLAEDLKTDAGAASDESWEKDFDLSDH